MQELLRVRRSQSTTTQPVVKKEAQEKNKSTKHMKLVIRARAVWMPNAVDATKTRDSGGRIPLHALCENDGVSVAMLEVLVQAYPGSVVAKDSRGALPLHLLCSNEAVTEALITPLHAAAKTLAPDALRVYLMFDHQDCWGQLPLHRMCANVWVYPQVCECLRVRACILVCSAAGACMRAGESTVMVSCLSSSLGGYL